MYLIRFSKMAEKDKKLLKGAGLERKAKDLLNMLAINPFQNPPPYEELVGTLNGYYSRRMNLQHRLVYAVYEETMIENEVEYEGIIKVARMWTQYDRMR